MGRGRAQALRGRHVRGGVPGRRVRRRRPHARGLRPGARGAPTCGPCAPACSRRTSSASTTSGPSSERLYVVSEERKLTPMNQLVLSHELRHALQDQYMHASTTSGRRVSDYDDRQLAFLSLLEGDATLRDGALPAEAAARRRAWPAGRRRAADVRDGRDDGGGGARRARRWCATSSCCPTSPAATSSTRSCGSGAVGGREGGLGAAPGLHRAGPAPREVRCLRGAAAAWTRRREPRARARAAAGGGPGGGAPPHLAGRGERGGGGRGLGGGRLPVFRRGRANPPVVARRSGIAPRTRGEFLAAARRRLGTSAGPPAGRRLRGLPRGEWRFGLPRAERRRGLRLVRRGRRVRGRARGRRSGGWPN